MVETWLRDSKVRLPAPVMLETWSRESGDPLPKEPFLLGSFVFLCLELSRFLCPHLQLSNGISDKYTRLSCLKHGCGRAGFDSLHSHA